MSFVSVKCTHCGGRIELDDQREKGFCMYCGSQIVYKEAFQNMELSGEVPIKGIADLEKLLQNAETFVKLEEYKKAAGILLDITDHYPEDYRGWWRLALFAINCPYKNLQGHSISGNSLGSWEYFFNAMCWQYGSFNALLTYQYGPIKLIRNAVNMAPSEKASEMKRQAKEWLQTYIEAYPLALQFLKEDLINASLSKEAIDRAQSSDKIPYHFEWYGGEWGSDTQGCIDHCERAENDLKQGLDKLQEQIKEFEA